MKKGVSRMSHPLVSVLQAFSANSRLCLNDGACDDPECESACMVWADLIKVEPEQLSEVITLPDQIKL